MEKHPKKFKVVTLGCRTNQYESEAYTHQLKGMGYEEALEGQIADICIVNTCTVTESADSSSRYQIRQLAKYHPEAKLVVTGCLAERMPEEIGGIPGVTHVVSNLEKEQLLENVFPEETLPEFQIRDLNAHTRAFVKVQDGCNSFCTYCILPYVRGRSRSRRLSEILEEIQGIVASGCQEVVLTGINVGDFDGNPGDAEQKVTLAELVRAVDQIPGIKRIRVSSIDPDEVDESLASAILDGKNTCPSMHVVLQSGSNVILKRMNRKYTRQVFLETVEYLKSKCKDFTFTTDVIVGFPGETETDFQETIDVMQKVKFAKVHMFPYSVRPRTRAALYPNKVNSQEMQKRKQRVLHLSEQIAFELRDEYVGRTMSVLLENSADETRSFGHTANFLPVYIEGKEFSSNQMVMVKLIQNTPEGFIGIPA